MPKKAEAVWERAKRRLLSGKSRKPIPENRKYRVDDGLSLAQSFVTPERGLCGLHLPRFPSGMTKVAVRDKGAVRGTCWKSRIFTRNPKGDYQPINNNQLLNQKNHVSRNPNSSH